MTCFAFGKYVAKRDHKKRCCLCGERILRGDEIHAWTYKDDVPVRLLAHEPCYGVFCRELHRNAIDSEWCGEFAFEDGDEYLAECKASVAASRDHKEVT